MSPLSLNNNCQRMFHGLSERQCQRCLHYLHMSRSLIPKWEGKKVRSDHVTADATTFRENKLLSAETCSRDATCVFKHRQRQVDWHDGGKTSATEWDHTAIIILLLVQVGVFKTTTSIFSFWPKQDVANCFVCVGTIAALHLSLSLFLSLSLSLCILQPHTAQTAASISILHVAY